MRREEDLVKAELSAVRLSLSLSTGLDRAPCGGGGGGGGGG